MELIEIPVPDGTAEAYVAHPPAGEGPGVLFFMDAIGVRPQIAAMCDRIASWGYVVLAPNVFHREGSVDEVGPQADLMQPGERDAFFEKAMPRVGRLTPDQAVPDIAAYLTSLRGIDGVADGRVGVVGYCMGARLATRTAGLRPDVVAAVGGFHGGGLVTDDPDSPHLGLSHARAEFVFGHADNDRGMPPEAVERLGQVLADAGLTAKNEIYPDSPHGYSMNDTSMYHEPGAERSFEALHALLDRALAHP
jgi:carboxymethylenebutenolidase